jgi:hypothetical protein
MYHRSMRNAKFEDGIGVNGGKLHKNSKYYLGYHIKIE